MAGEGRAQRPQVIVRVGDRQIILEQLGNHQQPRPSLFPVLTGIWNGLTSWFSNPEVQQVGRVHNRVSMEQAVERIREIFP